MNITSRVKRNAPHFVPKLPPLVKAVLVRRSVVASFDLILQELFDVGKEAVAPLERALATLDGRC